MDLWHDARRLSRTCCADLTMMTQRLPSAGMIVPNLTTMPMDQFELRWRFTNPAHRALPRAHLEHIKPLHADSAEQLGELISYWHPLPPAGLGGFTRMARTRIDAYGPDEVQLVRKWLYERAIPFKRQVFVLWDRHTAAITSWKMIVRYWDAFWYASSDDVFVFDASLSWLLFLWHEEEAFFASSPAFIKVG